MTQIDETSDKGQLTADDLFKLARDKSAKGRTNLAETISELFDGASGELTDKERNLMFNILQGIIQEVEVSVRKNLSGKLASAKDAPYDLISMLANDEISVAYPILSQSSVLRDMDLVDVIKRRTNEHQLAITLRDDISENVSDALVENGDTNVVENLLRNDNAKISETTLEYLVEQSQRIDTFQDPLLHRSDLKEDLAKRMFMWVSAALRQHIVDRYEIDEDEVDALLEEATLDEIDVILVEKKNKEQASTKLAATLKNENLATPNMLVAALMDGEVALFIAMFSELTGLNQTLTARIIFEPGGEGMAIACKAVDIPEFQFGTLFKMSRKSKPSVAKALDIELPKVLHLYRRMDPEAAVKVLHRWQRGGEYLSAIRLLQNDG
ncbi:MAG: DUF2336 domain-containing protein [Rhodospirillales bacterium]|nr:DUF2336 domain-containing protein [Rhodospirillales bacterium]